MKYSYMQSRFAVRDTHYLEQISIPNRIPGPISIHSLTSCCYLKLFTILNLFLQSKKCISSVNPLRPTSTKWSNTLTHFVGRLPTNCLSVFYHFVGLALKRFTWPFLNRNVHGNWVEIKQLLNGFYFSSVILFWNCKKALPNREVTRKYCLPHLY